MNRDIFIIGAGPSGIAAAVQLARYGIKTTIITKDLGGLIINANLIENYLGFTHGITGMNFRLLLKAATLQYEDFIEIVYAGVSSVSKTTEGNYYIQTTARNYMCNILLIATGTIPRLLNVPGENVAFRNKKLFYHVFTYMDYLYDLLEKTKTKPLFKIGVVGGGDVAYDYALNLKGLALLTIYQKDLHGKALPLLKKRIEEFNKTTEKNGEKLRPPITISPNMRIKKIDNSEDGLNVTFIDGDDNIIQNEVDYLLVAIGRKSNLSFLHESLQKNLKNKENPQTLFFIGDVRNSRYRQVSIAAADGIKTAMQIFFESQNI